MLGEKYMNKTRMNRKAIMSSGLPYMTMLNDLLDRGRDLGLDPFEEENDRLKDLRMSCDDGILLAEHKSLGRKGKPPVYVPTIQSEWSMRMKKRDGYKTYGKNEQKPIRLDDYDTAEAYWKAIKDNSERVNKCSEKMKLHREEKIGTSPTPQLLLEDEEKRQLWLSKEMEQMKILRHGRNMITSS